MHAPIPSVASVESRQSWIVAFVALFVMMLVFGAGWITSVALTDIAAEAGGARSDPRTRDILRLARRGHRRRPDGTRRQPLRHPIDGRVRRIHGRHRPCDLDLRPAEPLWIGHAMFMGLLGIGAINAPMYVYISHWFDRRRGSALALISSGSYLAGALWPPLFERSMTAFGWRHDHADVRRIRHRAGCAAGALVPQAAAPTRRRTGNRQRPTRLRAPRSGSLCRPTSPLC